MTISTRNFYIFFYCIIHLYACQQQEPDHAMLKILDDTNKKVKNHLNSFSPAEKLTYIDSMIQAKGTGLNNNYLGRQYIFKANTLLELGKSEEAATIFKSMLQIPNLPDNAKYNLLELFALSNLRIGEQTNCIHNHTTDACIFPIVNGGIHKDLRGSKAAIEIYQEILQKNPNDLISRWLLNIAYMTTAQYPAGVPEQWLIPGLEDNATPDFLPFKDIAPQTGLATNDMAGGVISEDFDNDGYTDLVTSSWSLDEPMHYFKNMKNGHFEDRSVQSRLSKFKGGLNIMQTDYNNDGFKDIFVLRGGWIQDGFGEQPNSLLKNNGDGTFTDVTIEAGLLSFNPTQTATWNDFNNDGWLDLFIGNETSNGMASGNYPCELFLSNKNGTFKEVAAAANCNITSFVKGVTSGDYNNDGWKDIFISTMSGRRILLKNEGQQNGQIKFTDATIAAKLNFETSRTFPTWFWDFDNDGWLDIFVGDYNFERPLSYYAAAEYLTDSVENIAQTCLYRNNHDGTFTNIAKASGLNKAAFAMGANFGDLDNDGYLDIFLGTGNPDYRSLVPNKMFRNLGGKQFEDVTTAAKVGNLQKGHAVSFSDMDNDGDQDIYIDMGGAFPGDVYKSSFYLNPKRNKNNWICINLEGTRSNKAAIGSSLKIAITENGIKRFIYRDVNSGGSFGASPLRREIGIGTATKIDTLEIKWHGSGKTQIFSNIACNQFLKIIEGVPGVERLAIKPFRFQSDPETTINCIPKIAMKGK